MTVTDKSALVVPHLSDTQPPLRLSLVIPTYNEAKNIETLVAELCRLFDPVLGQDYELIVVDDASPDGTYAIAEAMTQRYPRLRVVLRSNERGLSGAVIRGWQVARGDTLGVMDGDLQHPPEVNLKLLSQLERGADLAVASRHVEGGGVSDWILARRALSRGAQLLGLLVLPEVLGRVSDPMSGYFMVRRAAIAEKLLRPLGYKILIEVLARGAIRWTSEVGYVFREREAGESKVHARVYLDYVWHLLKLRFALLRESRLLRFCLVGASGVLVDMGLLYLLSDPHALGWNVPLAKAVAAECAVVTNFLLNDAWTFRDRSAQRPGLLARARRFLGFNAVCGIGIGLNLLIIGLLWGYLHLNRYVANAIAILLVTAWNYTLNVKLNWSPLRVTAEEPEQPGTKH